VSQKTEHDPTGSSAFNPFDPASLRLDQNYVERVGVRKLLTTVPVRNRRADRLWRSPMTPATCRPSTTDKIAAWQRRRTRRPVKRLQYRHRTTGSTALARMSRNVAGDLVGSAKTRHGEFRNKEKSGARRAEQRGFVGFEFEMFPR